MRPGSPPPPAASVLSFHLHDHQLPYFLDSCFLCHKKLTPKSDIYMYRGDTAFCSQECRQEQIQMDEATKRRKQKRSSSSSASSRAASLVQKKTVIPRNLYAQKLLL